MSINLLKGKNNPAILGSHNLPTEYQEVEYLESTGEQYIDTGKFQNQAGKFVLDIQFTDTTASQLNGSYRYANQRYDIGIGSTGDFNVNIGSVTAFGVADTNRHLFTLDNINGKVSIDATTQNVSIVSYDAQSTQPILIAGWKNRSGNLSLCKEKIYSGALYNYSGDVLLNFIPCYRKSDNKPGLYDIINSAFYTNANTSATTDFIAGPEVGFDIQEVEPYILKKRLDIPSAYQEVEYLENTGEQWITPINYYNNNFKVECSFEVSNLTKTYYLFNAYYDNSNRMGLDYKNPVGCRWGDYYTTSTASSLGKHSIVFSKDGFILDGVNIYTPTTSLTNRNISPYIFGMNVNGESVGKSPAGMKLYSFLLYENNTLIRNFIPCYRKSDNKPGLYDTINSQFYTNANTSASQDFIVGNDVNKYTLQPVDINLLDTHLPSYIDPILNNNSWDTINKVCCAGKALDYWSLGDIKEVAMSDGYTYHVQLVDATPNRYEMSDDSGYSQVVFQWVEFLVTSYKMNSTNTNVGGFAECAMRTALNTTVYNQLPADLKAVIAEVSVESGTGGGTTSGTSSSSNKLFLPCAYEIFGEKANGIGISESPLGQFDWYNLHNTAENRIKKKLNNTADYWWLRSPRSNNSTGFVRVNTNGNYVGSIASADGGVSPCFALGPKLDITIQQI